MTVENDILTRDPGASVDRDYAGQERAAARGCPAERPDAYLAHRPEPAIPLSFPLEGLPRVFPGL